LGGEGQPFQGQLNTFNNSYNLVWAMISEFHT